MNRDEQIEREKFVKNQVTLASLFELVDNLEECYLEVEGKRVEELVEEATNLRSKLDTTDFEAITQFNKEFETLNQNYNALTENYERAIFHLM
nr:Putative outer membrane protein, probably involved in nutrient binding [Moritella viscosa]